MATMKTEFLRAALSSWMQPVKFERRRRCSWDIGLARGIAAFFGVFSLMNLAGSLWNPWFDASHWWIRFDVGLPLARELLLLSNAVFLTFICLESKWPISGKGLRSIPSRRRNPIYLRQMPFLVARETAAWWVYYIRPVILPSFSDNHAKA
jgi:hypothetical protein